MTDEVKPEAAEPNRDQQIHFRVTADEKTAIEARAKAAGFRKVSDYLRVLGMGAEVKEVLPAELRRQLVGIGTNLNQIARLAQAGKTFPNHEAQLVQALSIIRGYLV
ncbi:plasmid mobilization protein [Hymenobacter koreensis]|uniref:Plasmid mobilization relaxosome protein MobC n=1 Tax=Hymenobacter koreensis TaxID=1084523 RepID=A0ABP8IY59_9BACT